jgi:hypothetical protein
MTQRRTNRKLAQAALDVCESNLMALTEYHQQFTRDMSEGLESDSRWVPSDTQLDMLFGSADRIDSSWRRRFWKEFRDAASTNSD